MKEEETFRASFPLHQAFKRTIPVPLALLRYYREVGLNDSQLLYILHILDAYITDQTAANIKQIARLMGVTERTLQRHNAYFRQSGLVAIKERFANGSQLENAYDFTPLLDKVAGLWATDNPLQIRIDNVAPLLNQLAAAMGGKVGQLKEKGDLGMMLGALIESWQITMTPGDTTITPPGDTTITPPGDTTITPPGDRNVTPNDDDDDLHTTDRSDDHHHQAPGFNGNGNGAGSPVDKLVAIGFDRKDASYLIGKAARIYGGTEPARAAVNGWVAEANRKGRLITNPAGFVRSKLERGAEPPAQAVVADSKACPGGCGRFIPKNSVMCSACMDAAGIRH